MFYHGDVQLANEIKSTKFWWKFTTFSMILHQTLSCHPMTSQLKKRKRDSSLAVQDYIQAAVNNTTSSWIGDGSPNFPLDYWRVFAWLSCNQTHLTRKPDCSMLSFYTGLYKVYSPSPLILTLATSINLTT